MNQTATVDYMAILGPEETARARAAFFVLEILGSHVMLPILAGTYVFIGRNPYLTNMLVTWMVASVLMCLLYYSRDVDSMVVGPLCVFQSAFVFALPPMLATSLLCLMYTTWSAVERFVNPQLQTSHSRVRTVLLLTIPYVNFLVFSLWGGVVALTDVTGISYRHYFYCSVRHGVYSTATAVMSAALLFLSLAFTVRLSYLAMKYGVELRRCQLGYGNWLFDVMRKLVFAVVVTVSSSLSIVTLVEPSIAPDLCLAALPVFFGLLFGSSRDVWMTWLRRMAAPEQAHLPPVFIRDLEAATAQIGKKLADV